MKYGIYGIMEYIDVALSYPCRKAAILLTIQLQYVASGVVVISIGKHIRLDY